MTLCVVLQPPKALAGHQFKISRKQLKEAHILHVHLNACAVRGTLNGIDTEGCKECALDIKNTEFVHSHKDQSLLCAVRLVEIETEISVHELYVSLNTWSEMAQPPKGTQAQQARVEIESARTP
jgi:hypothetical protein